MTNPLNNGEKKVLRSEEGKILPGSAPLNPAGKPKGTKHLTTLLFTALQKQAKDGKTYQDLLVERILNDAIIKGKGDIIKLAMNYVDGMPDQAIDISSQGERINTASADVMAMAKEINERLKAKKTE
jgi:hypothetical protein